METFLPMIFEISKLFLFGITLIIGSIRILLLIVLDCIDYQLFKYLMPPMEGFSSSTPNQGLFFRIFMLSKCKLGITL